MKKRESLIGPDGEVRELDDAFFARARRGRPPLPAGERKVRMNLMIDADVAQALQGVDNKSAFVTEAVRKALAG
jgi:hypothetical protein